MKFCEWGECGSSRFADMVVLLRTVFSFAIVTKILFQTRKFWADVKALDREDSQQAEPAAQGLCAHLC